MFEYRLLAALPAETCEKLLRLDAARRAARAAFVDASDRAEEARREYALAEAEARRRSAMPKGVTVDVHPAQVVLDWRRNREERERENDAEGARLRAPAEAAKSRLQVALDAKERAAEAQSRFYFLEKVEDWLRRNVTPGRTFRRCIVTPPKAPRGYLPAVEQLRGELRVVGERRQEIETAPLPPNELLNRAVREIDAVAKHGALRINPCARGPEPVTSLQELLRISAVPVSEAGGLNIFGTGAGGGALFAWLHRDALVERVEQMISALPTKGCLSDEEREARLAEIDASRLEVERAEEALICKAEAEGQTIPRRTDANPLAILELEMV